MKYQYLNHFYKNNRDILIEKQGLKPAKSVTRNILTSVPKFVEWFNINHENQLTESIIASEICHLTETGKSTIKDNIRNMIELKFLVNIEIDKYSFTRSFIDYVYKKEDLDKYILTELKQIDSVNNMTMFYNFIICALREADIYGYTTLYPDSVDKFKNSVRDKQTRIEIMNRVYNLYGFSGRASHPKNDDYTPNANYRIMSTCVNLGLLKKRGNDEFGFQKFYLTSVGDNILETIDNNIYKYENQKENFTSENVNTGTLDNLAEKTKSIKDIYEELYDNLYVAQSENLNPQLFLDTQYIDTPQPLANQYSQTLPSRRDPQKAANAKEYANYKCEFDSTHVTFTSKNNKKQFVEAHHLIPMQLQGKFFYSLDVEANIVALCPYCHRLIHHAVDSQKDLLISKLYKDRVNRLRNCNILIEEKELINFYNRSE